MLSPSKHSVGSGGIRASSVFMACCLSPWENRSYLSIDFGGTIQVMVFLTPRCRTGLSTLSTFGVHITLRPEWNWLKSDKSCLFFLQTKVSSRRLFRGFVLDRQKRWVFGVSGILRVFYHPKLFQFERRSQFPIPKKSEKMADFLRLTRVL